MESTSSRSEFSKQKEINKLRLLSNMDFMEKTLDFDVNIETSGSLQETMIDVEPKIACSSPDQNKRGSVILKYPIELGLVSIWDCMEKARDHGVNIQPPASIQKETSTRDETKKRKILFRHLVDHHFYHDLLAAHGEYKLLLIEPPFNSRAYMIVIIIIFIVIIIQLFDAILIYLMMMMVIIIIMIVMIMTIVIIIIVVYI